MNVLWPLLEEALWGHGIDVHPMTELREAGAVLPNPTAIASSSGPSHDLLTTFASLAASSAATARISASFAPSRAARSSSSCFFW